MQPKLKKLVDKGLLWQGSATVDKQHDHLASGSDRLDEVLGGGWQLSALHECQQHHHFTEQRIITPLLEQALARQKVVFWIAPPALVSAAGLVWQLAQSSLHVVITAQGQEAAWAFEQVLRSGAGIALFWGAQQGIDAGMVRRWYKAVQTGRQAGFVFTDIAQQPEARSYTNRVQLLANGCRLDVVKRRYGWPVMNVAL